MSLDARAVQRFAEIIGRHIPPDRRLRRSRGEPPQRLTPRELEVAFLFVVELLTGAEAAERLGLSGRTIEAHVAAISSKMGVGVRSWRAALIRDYWRAVGFEEATTPGRRAS